MFFKNCIDAKISGKSKKYPEFPRNSKKFPKIRRRAKEFLSAVKTKRNSPLNSDHFLPNSFLYKFPPNLPPTNIDFLPSSPQIDFTATQFDKKLSLNAGEKQCVSYLNNVDLQRFGSIQYYKYFF